MKCLPNVKFYRITVNTDKRSGQKKKSADIQINKFIDTTNKSGGRVKFFSVNSIFL